MQSLNKIVPNIFKIFNIQKKIFANKDKFKDIYI